MFLILTKHIAKHELKPLRSTLSIKGLLDGAKKVASGLATELRPPMKNSSFRFFKVRIGNKKLARMIVFVVSGGQKIVPLLIRLKKDKKIGMNMSANNDRVVEGLKKNLKKVIADIETNNFEKFEI